MIPKQCVELFSVWYRQSCVGRLSRMSGDTSRFRSVGKRRRRSKMLRTTQKLPYSRSDVDKSLNDTLWCPIASEAEL